MIARILLFCAAILLAGCAEKVWSPDEAVAVARVVPTTGPAITLYTSINGRSGAGAHSAILVDSSERLLFDPAGAWNDDRAVPERDDVLYGMDAQNLANYEAFQGNGVFQLYRQRLPVTPEIAEAARQLVLTHGAAPKAFCTAATSSVLRSIPGLENLPSTMYPKVLMDAFAKVPGVTTELLHYDKDTRVSTLHPVPLAAN